MKRVFVLIPLLLAIAACGGNVCINDGVCEEYEELLGCSDCQPQILPERCTMDGGLSCVDFLVMSGEESAIRVSFRNVMGEDVEVSSVSMGTTDCTLASSEVLINETIAEGATFGVRYECEDDLEQGELFNGVMTIGYRTASQQYWSMMDGELHAWVGGPATGGAIDTLREGETNIYPLAHGTYEVTVIFVSDPGVTPEATLSVNGEISDGLEVGEQHEFACSALRIEDILVNSREGVVQFVLEERVC